MEVKNKQIEELKNQIEELKSEVESIKQLFTIQKNVLNFSEVKLYTNLYNSYTTTSEYIRDNY